ncbi:MAG: nucleotidyl transferase AbiEii/AbiGii toxin family protein [Clostridia bacterium]|nr:nucleotidyl transferase AbiEii/AbiGii toxin family protein [Clostridia bacterium]
MILHHNTSEFEELINLVSKKNNIPADAVRKDYYITLIMKNLADSEYVESIIFKGGTSLSKCYPGSIERFSEDIDLTYVPESDMSNKQISNKLKSVEKILITNGLSEKIKEERNDRNKSSFVWFNAENKDIEKIKLEIGSSVRPHPYSKMKLSSYIHQHLIDIEDFNAIEEFQLTEIQVNVLHIERTFIDKIMSVKRHAICGTLPGKVRHIYDVVRLYKMSEIQSFLQNEKVLKEIVEITKRTDSFYLKKRNIPENYNPIGSYNFESWEYRFNNEIKISYESLHKVLLYTNEMQSFDEAVKTFRDINIIFKNIEE